MMFSPSPIRWMHIDINSCFATIEQQANPGYRGIPLLVAAYAKPFGCVLAASREAKAFGVQTGMRVSEAQDLCRGIIVLEPDPNKYRDVHLKLKKLLSCYSDKCVAKSIDEFVLDLKDFVNKGVDLSLVGQEIKGRIRQEIGEWLSVSVGIAPNRYLAKIASNLRKPDGLEVIDAGNFEEVYKRLSLVDLIGIKHRNAARLNRFGIYNTWDFYQAPLWRLKAAFESVVAMDWYLRLKGIEADDMEFGRRSYGNSFVLPKVLVRLEDILPVVAKLTEKTGFRMRKAGYGAKGVWFGFDHWHRGHSLGKVVFDSRQIFQEIKRLLLMSPYGRGVKSLAVSCFDLVKRDFLQQELFVNVERKNSLVRAMDVINRTWGMFTVCPGTMISTDKVVLDRIAFGGVKELEEILI